MARGWESKSVADQIESAGEVARDEAERIADLSPEMRERVVRANSLKLSRTRILDQLDSATHPAHRETLMRALAAVELEIEDLNLECAALSALSDRQ